MASQSEESSNTPPTQKNLMGQQLSCGIEDLEEDQYVSLVGNVVADLEEVEQYEGEEEHDQEHNEEEEDEYEEDDQEQSEEEDEEYEEDDQEQIEEENEEEEDHEGHDGVPEHEQPYEADHEQPLDEQAEQERAIVAVVNGDIAIDGLEDMGSVNFNELGMNDIMKYHFPNREVAFLFYNWFCRMHGFAARKARVVKSKSGDVLQQTFVCFREGKRKDCVRVGIKRPRFPRKDSRCECKAHFEVHIDKEDKCWYVKSVMNVHNHTLVDMKLVGLVPGHRRMNEGDITQMNYMKKVGVTTAQTYGVFASQMGGYVNVPFGKAHMYNVQDKQRTNGLVDVRGVLALLRGLKEKDPGLFWEHTIDSEGRLEKLFWCDGVSKANYSLFGDVLAFDASYKKNQYRRPLVVFSGVNHHNHTIIFASALVSNESEDTYVWLLQNFLDAMKGKAPVSVITDGTLAMKNAIKKVFPRAYHRLCAWHLLRLASGHVSHPKFVQKLTICMLWDLEIADFEESWAEMVTECECADNEWVIDLYTKKKTWAAAHMRGEFFGGMWTTSRVEGLHAQVGNYVNSWNNLTDFMLNFNRYLSYQRQRELEADYASMQGEHVLQTQVRKLERSASNYYTNNIFKIVSRGLQRALIMRVNPYKETSTCSIFFVSRYCSSGRKWTVSFWGSSMDFKCSCMRMESHGLPCDHIFAVLVALDLVEMPKALVLHRWTKFAKDGLGPVGDQSTAWDPMVVCRFHALREACRRLCKVACKTFEAYGESNTLVLAQAKKLERGNTDNEPITKPSPRISNDDGDRYLRNPPMPTKRGRGAGSRGRGRARGTTHCGICGVAGHNRTSCTRHTQ